MTVEEPKKAAEAVGLSAILAIVFCGFTMVTYAEHNISAKSHTVFKQSMKLIAHISEMVIFILLGTSAVTDFWVHWNTAFVMWTLLFISVFRLISVYGLTAILNRNR
jgi:NhaP-type Na+/H+ or K+/H+ antiporter